MTQIKSTSSLFPFQSHKLIDEFNENNKFIDSKDQALSPLDDNLDEIERIEELQLLQFYKKEYLSNSNIIQVDQIQTQIYQLSQKFEFY